MQEFKPKNSTAKKLMDSYQILSGLDDRDGVYMGSLEHEILGNITTNLKLMAQHFEYSENQLYLPNFFSGSKEEEEW